jgi:hypothetical protein
MKMNQKQAMLYTLVFNGQLTVQEAIRMDSSMMDVFLYEEVSIRRARASVTRARIYSVIFICVGGTIAPQLILPGLMAMAVAFIAGESHYKR